MGLAQIGVAGGAAIIAIGVAVLDRGIVEYRYHATWVGRRFASLSILIYLAIHAVVAVVLAILSFSFLRRDVTTWLSGILLSASIGLTAEALLRAQWPRSLHPAGKVFSLLELIHERITKLRGDKVDKAVQVYLDELDDVELGQLTMDLMHEYTIPKATESGKRELLKEGRANIDALHGGRIGRRTDARAQLRKVARTIVIAEKETLGGKPAVTASASSASALP